MNNRRERVDINQSHKNSLGCSGGRRGGARYKERIAHITEERGF